MEVDEMEWLKELLKKAGFDESKIDTLIADVNKELPKHFVPKDKYNEVSEAKKQAETAVADRDKQLDDLQKSSGDADALKAQITKLQDENNAAKAKYEADMKDMQINSAIEKALTTAKAKHPDLLTGKIDKEKIELLADGTVKGLDDQIKPLQESYKELFESEEVGSQFHFKGFNPTEGGDKGNGGKSSVGASFAKSANEGGKPPAVANNPWG